jgi:hypothetical protein
VFYLSAKKIEVMDTNTKEQAMTRISKINFPLIDLLMKKCEEKGEYSCILAGEHIGEWYNNAKKMKVVQDILEERYHGVTTELIMEPTPLSPFHSLLITRVKMSWKPKGKREQ